MPARVGSSGVAEPTSQLSWELKAIGESRDSDSSAGVILSRMECTPYTPYTIYSTPAVQIKPSNQTNCCADNSRQSQLDPR